MYDLAQSERKKKVKGIYNKIQILGGAHIVDTYTGSYMNVFDRATTSTNTQPTVSNYTKKNFLELLMIDIDRK